MSGNNKTPSNKYIGGTVLWDGECGLCTITQRFLRNKDVHSNLRFEKLQKIKFSASKNKSFDTLVYLSNDGRNYIEARAVFEILRGLPGFWGAVGEVLSNSIINSISSPFYRFIARYRFVISNLLQFPFGHDLS